ncbi:alpha/beta fold hydrolase [Tamaricihabitans halophyticus]|uniref:alpha/beta fold hydrolase n=1 Tax=Tamaricihabitans halophyticus TaxID=1262583 RepID=UPI001FB35B20|nr:alpha/beta hydrolase [Tamaricihabitans halophyticus]
MPSNGLTLRYITSADGTRLAVREAAPAEPIAAAAPPIVLVHGWAQDAAVWLDQLMDPVLTSRHRVLAVELRGHGESAVPTDGYRDSATWAGDIRAVLAEVGTPSVLVGWSFGGLVLTDYVRAFGNADIAGLVLAGALTEIGRGRPGGRVGAAMRAALPAVLDADPAVAVPALHALITAMPASPLPGARLQRMLAASLRVRPEVRAALFDRAVDSADVLAEVAVPTLVLHGTEDAVVDPRAAEYALGKISGARARWFEGVGHLPFAERVREFNDALAAFAADPS